jgi:UDP-N-acetylmuramate--alanine ligase
LARRAGQDGQAGERCAVLVNDFGEARIDRLLLGGGVQVSDIAGGCVCCTAPAGLVPALTAILEELRPDRLFIEPSGLARPQDIVDMLARPVTTYGLKEGAQIRAVDVRAENGQMHFTVQRRNGVSLPDMPVVLSLPGEHNVLNALAAISVAVELGVDDAAVQRALAQFKGVGRRFQRYGEVKLMNKPGCFTLVDDYGHHPVEMAATLAAARGAFPDRRLVLAFQPHRYSRTRDCFEDFVSVIGHGADTVLLSEVYAAGEMHIVAADGRTLARALRVAGKIEPVFVEKIESMAQAIFDNANDGDIVICMGAGSIGAVAAQVQKMGGAV